MLKYARNLFAVAMIFVCGGGITSAQTQQRTKVPLALADEAFWYVLHYITDGAGYFKEEGVDIDIVRASSGSRQVAIVLGGSADVAPVNMAISLAANAGGGDAINLANVYAKMPLVVVLSNAAIKKTGITEGMAIDEKVKRLKDLKLGITSPGSGSDQVIRTLFVTRGMDPDKVVTLQPLGQGGTMLAALEQGSIDGFVFGAPFPQIVESKGLGKVVINPHNDEAPEFRDLSYMGLLTTRAALESKRPQLRAVMRAYTRGLKLAQENPAEARRVTRSVFASVPEDVYVSSFNEALTGLPKSLELNENQLDRTLKLMNLLSKKPIEVKYKDAISPDLAREASKDILGR
jgi:NitT/TauT family transport system substrate-binding protein